MKRILLIISLFIASTSQAQTDIDGIMMEKQFFCAGITYAKNTWKNYWEGSLKRENLNLGTVTNSNIMAMGNYGITDKLNVIFSVPYIKTKASAGQLAGQKGIQDLSITAKWVGYEKSIRKGLLRAIVIGTASTPLSNYTPDLLPLSIGLQSKTAQLRLMADYQLNNWTATISGAYIFRNNIKLDRTTYYTTRMHYTNAVKMPNAANLNCRIGYRSSTWIAEVILNQNNTLGGFDISRNNMPFASNKMNATSLGIHIKYDTDFVDGLSFVADGIATITGRNVGQTNGFNAGIFYIMDFSKKQKGEPQK
jgi:hypothetical protein